MSPQVERCQMRTADCIPQLKRLVLHDLYPDTLIIQRSTCVDHHAMKVANKSRSANLVSSGIGTIDCIQHNFKRPNSIGDLQNGEKYVHDHYFIVIVDVFTKYINMDYLFFLSMSHTNSVATVMTDVFQKIEINLLRKFAKIVRIFDKIDDSKSQWVIYGPQSFRDFIP
jgi:hypothetical protein